MIATRWSVWAAHLQCDRSSYCTWVRSSVFPSSAFSNPSKSSKTNSCFPHPFISWHSSFRKCWWWDWIHWEDFYKVRGIVSYCKNHFSIQPIACMYMLYLEAMTPLWGALLFSYKQLQLCITSRCLLQTIEKSLLSSFGDWLSTHQLLLKHHQLPPIPLSPS